MRSYRLCLLKRRRFFAAVIHNYKARFLFKKEKCQKTEKILRDIRLFSAYIYESKINGFVILTGGDSDADLTVL